MIWVIFVKNWGYMLCEGHPKNSSGYGARDTGGTNYWVSDIRNLANVPCIVPYKSSFADYEDAIFYGPFPCIESLANPEDYPECFV